MHLGQRNNTVWCWLHLEWHHRTILMLERLPSSAAVTFLLGQCQFQACTLIHWKLMLLLRLLLLHIAQIEMQGSIPICAF